MKQKKQMQEFREWLSSTDRSSAPTQRRLVALTQIDRTQLVKIANQPWFMWEASEPASVS